MLKIAHRGASGNFPENTLLAFQEAIKMGVDGIELDVRRCKTGELVVIHDDSVNRTTDKTGKVREMSLQQLKECNIEKNQNIPTLKEVLKKLGHKTFFNIELKETNISKDVLYLTSKLSMGKDNFNVLYSSFVWEEMLQMKRWNKNIKTAIITDKDNLDECIHYASEIKAKAIHPYYFLLNAEKVATIHAHGFKVNTWTVDEENAIKEMKRIGVDGIISNFPDRMV